MFHESQLILYAIAYLIGSIPFGLILAKASGMGDIRKVGSGNIGATNVLRAGGKKTALLTLLLDGGKGYLAIYIASNHVLDAVYKDAYVAALGLEIIMFAGLCAILGHCFPLWLKFKGGKGVATVFGVLFGLSLKLGALCAVSWLIIFFVSRYSSLAALTAMILMPLQAHMYGITEKVEQLAILAIISLLIIIRHRSNIRNLLAGKEHQFGKSKQESSDDAPST